MKELHAFAWLASLFFLLIACTQQSSAQSAVEVGDEVLGRALVETGFPCDRLVRADQLGDTASSWRIACSNAQVYLASLQEGGEICIEPVVYGDGGGPQPIVSPEARCTSLI